MKKGEAIALLKELFEAAKWEGLCDGTCDLDGCILRKVKRALDGKGVEM